MNDLRNKHPFLLSMSLTELGFILFFLLLLISSWKLREMSKEKDTAKAQAEASDWLAARAMAENEQTSEKIRDLKREYGRYKSYKKILDKVNMIPEEFMELIRDSEAALAENHLLEQTLREATNRNENLRAENEQLESVQAGLTRALEAAREEFTELARDSEAVFAEKRVLDQVLQEATGRNETLRAENERLEAASHDMTGQLRNYQKRLGRGRDFPPCWANESGQIEYLYRVVIREETLSVKPAWPERRADDIRAIPGAHEVVGDQMSIKEFRNRAAPILSWSKQREPECRHFVILIDRADTKNSFKAKRFAVEAYFYK